MRHELYPSKPANIFALVFSVIIIILPFVFIFQAVQRSESLGQTIALVFAMLIFASIIFWFARFMAQRSYDALTSVYPSVILDEEGIESDYFIPALPSPKIFWRDIEHIEIKFRKYGGSLRGPYAFITLKVPEIYGADKVDIFKGITNFDAGHVQIDGIAIRSIREFQEILKQYPVTVYRKTWYQ
jgi:hypothetical protein